MKKPKSVMRPLDGEFRASAEVREKWCIDNWHPQIYLNVSKSANRPGVQVFQCHCGAVESEQQKAAK